MRKLVHLDSLEGHQHLSAHHEKHTNVRSGLSETGELENVELSTTLINILHKAISSLDKNRFQVKMKLKYYDEFKKRSRWNNLNSDDVHILEEHLSALPLAESINENARRFDLMMLKLQIATLLLSSRQEGYHQNLANIADELSHKYTIPEVLRSRDLLESMKDTRFYEQLTQKRLEEIRIEIRELVHYLDAERRISVYTDLEDAEIVMKLRDPIVNFNQGETYRKRVEKFIRENKFHITISKLSTNQPITPGELKALEDILFDGGERGTKEDFVREFGEEPLGVFIRSILGLDALAAQEAFAEFLQAGNLNASQMNFIQTIIQHLTKNGTVDPAMLFESPFTDINDQGLIGVFDDGASHRIVSIVENINGNAVTG